MGSATAITPSAILRVEKAQMVRLLHRQHEMSDRFIAHMLTRNIRIEEDLIDQLFNSSEKRLARTLLLLARYGKEDKPIRRSACLRRRWRRWWARRGRERTLQQVQLDSSIRRRAAHQSQSRRASSFMSEPAIRRPGRHHLVPRPIARRYVCGLFFDIARGACAHRWSRPAPSLISRRRRIHRARGRRSQSSVPITCGR
jgi:hypothetical protein